MTTTEGRPFDQQARASQSIHKLLLPAVGVMIVAAITTSLAAGGEFQGRNNHDDQDDDDHERRGTYAIGLWGDLPYSTAQATTGVPNLIADMNKQDLAFTVHDGDLKAGSGSPCDDALYAQALGYFNALKAPAVFTPGDNDWTDCDRPANGGYSSLERLGQHRVDA